MDDILNRFLAEAPVAVLARAALAHIKERDFKCFGIDVDSPNQVPLSPQLPKAAHDRIARFSNLGRG